MGCDVGNIFGLQASRLVSAETISEKYLLAKKGFNWNVGGDQLGIYILLDIYNTRFYTDISKLYYGMDLGGLMVNTIKRFFRLYLRLTFCKELSARNIPCMEIRNYFL